MSKRSNRGKAYFYAKGQRDSLKDNGNWFSSCFHIRREQMQHISAFAFKAWLNGYNGY